MNDSICKGVVGEGRKRSRKRKRLLEKSKEIIIVPDGMIHPVMAAYGLWKDDPEMENLAREVQEEREKYRPRPEADL